MRNLISAVALLVGVSSAHATDSIEINCTYLKTRHVQFVLTSDYDVHTGTDADNDPSRVMHGAVEITDGHGHVTHARHEDSADSMWVYEGDASYFTIDKKDGPTIWYMHGDLQNTKWWRNTVKLKGKWYIMECAYGPMLK